MTRAKHAAKPKRRPGRPRFEPTEEQRAYVLRHRLAGYTLAQIAWSLNVHKQTLVRRFRDELEHGTRDLLGNLAAKAYAMAFAGDTRMLEFVLGTRGDWR
jgi:IS30 family transposase